MPLEHVSIWHENHGWQRITIDEADSLFSYSVSAKSRLFICDLCHKHVIFVKGVKQTSHFKHNKANQEKICADRAQKLSKKEQEALHRTITNPMRLVHDGNSLYLEIGFLPIPDDILEQAEKMKLQICVLANKKVLLVKNIDKSSFSSKDTVYYPINYFSDNYQLTVVPENTTHNLPMFNREFHGLNVNGTLFDYQSGKMIPLDGDVEVNKKYYLLTSNSYNGNPLDIEISNVIPQGKYCLYIVVAHKITKTTTEFFFKYHVRLTKAPTKLIPLWPILHEGGHYIETNMQRLFFLLKGDSSLKIEPSNVAQNIYVYKLNSNDCAQLICIDNVSRIRMVWAARQTVLKYLNVRYNPNEIVYSNKIYEQASAYMEDQTTLNNGIYNSLPQNRKLYVLVKYDGKIIRNRNDEIFYSKKVKANEIVILDRISYGEDIFVYHGMDKSLSVSFRRGNSTVSQNDNAVFAALNACTGGYVKFPPRLGWIISQLSSMPKTQTFFLSAKQEGKIRKNAIKLISQIIKEGDFNGNTD